MTELLLLMLLPFAEKGAAESLRLYLLSALPTVADGWVQSEVMEDWERSRWFSHPFSYFSHQSVMSDRLAEMEVDCPPTVDCKRLPSDAVCRDQWFLAYRYRRYLEHQLALGLWTPQEKAALEANIADTEWRQRFWDLARDCSGTWPTEAGRRLTLQRIRTLIGRQNYDRLEWPDPLPPSGYFQEWTDSPSLYSG